MSLSRSERFPAALFCPQTLHEDRRGEERRGEERRGEERRGEERRREEQGAPSRPRAFQLIWGMSKGP